MTVEDFSLSSPNIKGGFAGSLKTDTDEMRALFHTMISNESDQTKVQGILGLASLDVIDVLANSYDGRNTTEATFHALANVYSNIMGGVPDEDRGRIAKHFQERLKFFEEARILAEAKIGGTDGAH